MAGDQVIQSNSRFESGCFYVAPAAHRLQDLLDYIADCVVAVSCRRRGIAFLFFQASNGMYSAASYRHLKAGAICGITTRAMW